MRKQAYSILVYNNPGLLSRMAGLFSRRGYNIESITAGTTADPRFTRITIVASGDEQILSQIEKQVRKMEDVIEVKPLNDSNSVCRELVMIKVRANASERADLISLADIFRAKIVDVEKDCLMIELTGTESKLKAFMELLEGYEILEYNYRCKTGEIDIIAREAGYLVFCEVKYRASDKKGHPAEAVNPAKQRTISKSALCYMAVNGIDEVPCRFDVVSIENHEVTLYRNAFDYIG